jgi:RimJ/RimL family protein N-acetyltransferase
LRGRLICTIEDSSIQAAIPGGEKMPAVRTHEEQAVESGKSFFASAFVDANRVTVRPVRQSDVVLIQAMHRRLSKESVYYRYLAPHAPDLEALQRLCFLDNPSGVAIVATVQEPHEKVVAMACFCVDPEDPAAAEPAILVEDSYQGRGLGNRIFMALCQQARQHGLERFECFTHPANHRMLCLIKGCGLRSEGAYSQGVREIRIWLKAA